MKLMRKKPPIDAVAGERSPLGVAISVAEGATLDLVRAAIDAKRLRLAYQPVVLAKDPARVAFYEGLMRVLEPSGRVIPAKDFMTTVETTELGRKIDCAALELGLKALAKREDLRLSVNMSARSIGYSPFMDLLRRGLAVAPTIGERLILEISESSAMLMPEIVAAFMEEVQMAGVAFALDDFGSGQFAVRHFKEFCFDIVKLDGRYLRGLDRDPGNRAVAMALLAIGRSFEMFTVANAIETPAEAAILQQMGVDCMQGYLFGAPSLKPSFEQEAARIPA
jgi:EAL domain-containing protein (putative c-di-GMP-specific phosphodiesterase class I)